MHCYFFLTGMKNGSYNLSLTVYFKEKLMSRIVKCAHIQASNPKHDGTVAEIKEAMIQKHIPLIEEAGKRASRYSVSRKYSTGHISVLSRISNGMNRLSPFRVLQLNAWQSMLKNIIW